MAKQVSTIVMKTPEIFTTGAFLRPVRVNHGDGDVWVWAVIGFEEDSFMDGDIYNPPEYAASLEELTTLDEKKE